MSEAKNKVDSVLPSELSQEECTPFDIVDPFYSESNIRYLEEKMEAYRAGKLHFAEHDLIED